MNEVRIRLSVGLVAAAAVHALLLAGVFEGLHQLPKMQVTKQADTELQLPAAPVNYQYDGPIVKLQEPAHVNTSALGEKKQQIGRPCVNCPPVQVRQPQYSQPHYVQPQYVQPQYVQPQYAQPTLAPAMPTRTVQPTGQPTTLQPTMPPVQRTEHSILQTTAQATAQTLPKKYWQLTVFVGTDARSKTLLSWVQTHPKFIGMRNGTDVQILAKDDLLYKTRYASVIPPDQFPAIVLADHTGGHVHAAGGNMIPSTAEQLYADFQAGAKNYLQAKNSAPAQQQPMQLANGLVKTTGYSWDNGIHPAMQLMTQNEDCPGGICPDDREARTPLRDLFGRDDDSRSALLWFGNNEIATGVLLLVIVGVVIYLIKKHNG